MRFAALFVPVVLFAALHACSSDSPADATDAGAGDGGDTNDAAACTIAVAATGNDATCTGAAGAPACKTLTKALSVAAAGCTVNVAKGTYKAGETFPLEIKDGVRVVGAGDGTVIDDSDGTSTKTIAVSCPGTSDAQRRAVVTLAGKSALMSVKVIGASGAADVVDVLVTGGDVEIGAVSLEGGEDGVYVTGAAKANVHDVTATGAGRSGIKPAGTSNVTIVNATVSGTKNGVEAICGSTSTVDKSDSFCNGNGVFVSGQAKAKITGTKLHSNHIGAASKGADSLITLIGNTIKNNAYGIVSVQGPVEAGNKATEGANTIVNGQAGIYLEKVATDVIAYGNTWVPNKDGADANGKYVGDQKFAPPMCPTVPYGTLDADPADTCTGSETVAPAANYQQIVLVDATCPPTGPAVQVGTLALSTN